MKAAIGRTARTPARVARIGTTTRGTRTGTLASVPPVTTSSCARAQLRLTRPTIAVSNVVSPRFLLRQTPYWVRRAASSETSKPAPTFLMGKKYRNLIGRIADRDNLIRAYENAARGKRRSLGYLVFKEHLAANLAKLQSEILDGSYAPGEYRRFMVYEPKLREVAALPFYDRVAQHALCNIIEPIFDIGFVPQSYACRRNKGTHAGAIAVQALMRCMAKHGPVFILKTDFSKYFASIDRAILHREIRRKISCRATLALIEVITPPTGTGLPIGNLTSQLYANIFGNIFDRWLIARGHPRFIRYMDDAVIFSHTAEALQLLRMGMEWFAETQGMRFSRWSISPAERGVNFLGYRIFPTHKLLRRRSVVGAKRKLANISGEKRERFLSAWLGHAAHADTYNLLTKMGVSPCTISIR